MTGDLILVAAARRRRPPDATACNVAATYNGIAVPSATITRVDWDWGDGVGQTVNGSPLGSHPYAQAWSYRIEANVDAMTVDGTKKATVSQTLVIP